MNDFHIYEQLCEMSNIASQYPDGKEYGQKVRQVADRVASQLYRVAVIGEFKRGKSSLINALLGNEVLPTDILPMTAAITHVTYGETRKIIIKYKDGREEERTVEQLIDFATKYDEEKERTAKTIREITVSYPSVFCKNHIEIIDTPGMNDNDNMSAITLSILGEIDTAIMVISATSPMSITEQELILTLIEQPGIRHIVFVVTHIDDVSPKKKDQDMVISFIKNRISGDLLLRAEDRFFDDEEMNAKAYKILEDSDVFGVSSTQAIAGFVQDSEELLEKSRFPFFKQELLALLTAAQSADISLNALDALKEIESKIEEWYQNAHKYSDEDKLKMQELQKQYAEYFKNAKSGLIQRLGEMDAALQGEAFSNGFANIAGPVRKTFIKALSSIRDNNNTHENILLALEKAKEESRKLVEQELPAIQKRIGEEMEKVYVGFQKSRPLYERSEKETQYPGILDANLAKWRDNTPFPAFHWSADPIPQEDDLTYKDIMPYIQSAVTKSLVDYGMEIDFYIASWRAVLLKHNRALVADHEVLDMLEKDIGENTVNKNLLAVNYKKHREALDGISEKLRY